MHKNSLLSLSGKVNSFRCLIHIYQLLKLVFEQMIYAVIGWLQCYDTALSHKCICITYPSWLLGTFVITSTALFKYLFYRMASFFCLHVYLYLNTTTAYSAHIHRAFITGNYVKWFCVSELVLHISCSIPKHVWHTLIHRGNLHHIISDLAA